MTKNKMRRAIALVLCLAALALIVIGGVNMPRKSAAAGTDLLNELRTGALMNAAGDGIVESYVAIAKKLVLETIVKLNREKGMTVVIVSSELQELRSISDRIAIVSEGKLVDILPPDASDADFGLAMSGIKPSEHKKEG